MFEITAALFGLAFGLNGTRWFPILNVKPVLQVATRLLAVLATKIPKTGLKVFPEFLQKSPKNLQFHL